MCMYSSIKSCKRAYFGPTKGPIQVWSKYQAQQCEAQMKQSFIYKWYTSDLRYILSSRTYTLLIFGLCNKLRRWSVNLTGPPPHFHIGDPYHYIKSHHHESITIPVQIRNNSVVCGNQQLVPAKFHDQILFDPKPECDGIIIGKRNSSSTSHQVNPQNLLIQYRFQWL